MQIFWDQRYAQRTQRMRSSAIRELLKATEISGMISFAGGLPAPELFPTEKIAAAALQVLQTKGTQALQYSATEGYRPLRELIAQRMSDDDMTISVDNVLITSGSQQALDLLGKIFIDEDDPILVESPTYMGAFQSLNPYGARYLTLPLDEHGMVTHTDALSKVLQAQPKFIYALPNFQNPTGVTLSLERRQQLVKSANHSSTPIVEDDPYGQLCFEGEPLQSLIKLDSMMREKSGSYQGNVIYLSTFSKLLAPGLRIGWVIAAPEVIRKMVQAKQGTDLHTSTLNQMIAYEMISEGFLEQQIPLIRSTYYERRNIMLAEMEEHFPEGIRWTRPKGGMFLWVTLPEGMNSAEVLKIASEQKVIFVPGTSFHALGGGTNTLRLSFSNAAPEMISDGIARLGRVLHKAMAKRDSETAV